MTEAEELDQQAQQMPYGTERAAVHRRAVELADASGDDDLIFRVRIGHITSAAYGGDPMGALAAFAWCRARLDDDPERFARHDYEVNWVHKWMPGQAARFPTVGLERIDAIVDDLERRHVAAGSGRRSAVAERIGIDRMIGRPTDDVAGLLADWRSTGRASLSDCLACETSLEMRTLEYIGAPPSEVVTLADPYLRGEARFCADGPKEIYFVGLRALLETGQLDRARELLWKLVRETEFKGDRSNDPARAAVLLAAVGEHQRSVNLAVRQIVHLSMSPSPYDEMVAAAALAGAYRLANMSGEIDPVVRLPDRRPQYLADHPSIVGMDELVDALRRRADELAVLFDRRNGTDRASTFVRELAEHPPLVRIDMDALSTTSTVAASPTRAAVRPTAEPAAEAADAGGAVPAQHDAVDLGDVPDDAFELDEWIGHMIGSWKIRAVEEALAGFVDDAQLDSSRWLVITLWLTTPGDPSPLDRIAVTAADVAVPVAFRARAAARLALSAAMGRGDDVSATVDVPTAVDMLRGLMGELDSGDPAQHLALVSAWRSLAEVHALLDEPEPARQALDQARALLGPSSADHLHRGVAYAALMVIGHAMHAHGPGVPEAGTDPDSVEPVVRAVLAVVRDHPIGSQAASLALQAAGYALDAQLLDLAHEAAALAIELTPRHGGDDVLRFRFAALLTLADARGMVDGPAAALEVQRETVDVARSLGQPHPLGWARRGLALQLQALGRLDEASVLLAEAADLLAEAGDTHNACLLDVRQGWLELDLREWVRADRAATRAATRMVELPDDARTWIEFDVEELSATCAERGGNWDAASAGWLRVADLAVALGQPAAGFRSAAALCRLEVGDQPGALALLDEADGDVESSPPEQQVWLRARVESRRGDAYSRIGRVDEAVDLYGQAAEGFRSADDLIGAASCALAAARAAHDVGGPEAARPRYEAALDLGLAAGDQRLIADVRWGLADALEESGRLDEAAEQRRLADG